MTTIDLGGVLGKKFFRSKDFFLETGSAWEVFKALRATVEGFTEEVARLDSAGMRFAIICNGKNVGEKDFDFWGGGVRKLKIVPVISGSKRVGVPLQDGFGVHLDQSEDLLTGLAQLQVQFLEFVLVHPELVPAGFERGRATEPVVGVFYFERVHWWALLILLLYTVIQAGGLSEGELTNCRIWICQRSAGGRKEVVEPV
ncbi:hypothetical protein [Pseudomonas sp. SDO55104_S430]